MRPGQNAIPSAACRAVILFYTTGHMSLSINADAVKEAHSFLRELPSNAQTRGDRYFRDGRVASVTAENGGASYSAVVEGSQPYTVHLSFTDDDGWVGDCTCAVGYDCKHVYAAMKALLAEHTRNEVQRLSSGAVSDSAAAKSSSAAAASFPDQVQAALGRALKAEEKKFLAQLQRTFAHCQQVRSITYWDFEHMGLRLPGHGYQALQIWPSFPETLRDFWLYVAYAAAQQKVVLPEFMLPVTNLDEVRAHLQRWQRAKEIERWKQALGSTHPRDAEIAPKARPIDLCLRFGEKGARLEWQPAPNAPFTPIKAMQAQQLQHDLDTGLAELPPEAEWLWQAFQDLIYPGASTPLLEYISEEARQTIARLLRIEAVRSRLLMADGRKAEFAPEPLRWSLDFAEKEDDDYRIRLTRHDGTPAPAILATLPGHPTLYLGDDWIFRGPPLRDRVLDVDGVTRIPAPALESRGGVALLHSLGIDLPPRLRDRVRMVPFTLKIRATLRPSNVGSTTEVCALRARAESGDGQEELTWNGHTWYQTREINDNTPKAARNRAIVLHDRSALHDPRALFSPLEAKWEPYLEEFTLRVTKKFPDTFAAWLKTLPPDVKPELQGDLASLMTDTVVGSLRLEATEAGIDWFDLRVVLDVADTTLTPAELKLLLNARGGYVRLGEKGWRRLQFNLTEQEDEQLARLGLTPRELSAEPQRLHALQLADDAAKNFLPEQQFASIQRRAGEIKARVTPDVPATISADLRPYQREGFHFLAYLSTNSFGGVLADDMGLGKTLQTLTWLEWLRAQPRNGKPAASLVVCPKSVMDNWHAEAARFLPGLRVKVWGASELKAFKDHCTDTDLHVINYNQLRTLGESLTPVNWHAVILDEGQYIKNPSSLTAQIARSLRAEQRLVLSGTPIENRLLDLWSLMSFAMPGVLGSRAQFAKLYDSKEDPHARRRLSARVRPFLLRRTKAQVAKDLPDRIEEDLFCEIEGEQKTLYRAELKRAQQMLLRIQTQKQLNQDRFHLLTSLLRLRQICCHPRLVKEDSKAPSAKVEALIEQLEPIVEEGNKVLVFSQFVTMLEILRPEIESRGWPVFYLAGDTENRGDLVKQFQATEGPAVFLISLKAGGFGLNLTAASYVVLFDPWWNPAVENQAIDRTHRIGQQRNVIAYRLLIKDSIEEKIRALQKTKSSLAQDVLGEEKFSQSLTLADLNFLFSDT